MLKDICCFMSDRVKGGELSSALMCRSFSVAAQDRPKPCWMEAKKG